MKRISHHSAASETLRASLSCARQLKALTARVQAQQTALTMMCADGASPEDLTRAGEVLAGLLTRLRATQAIAREVEFLLKEQKHKGED